MKNVAEYIDEVWKEIPGYSKYMVSNLGRIKSLPTLISRPTKGQYMRESKILTGAEDACGYMHVRLMPDNGDKAVLWKIHQIVAYVFLGYQRNNPENIVVDHIDSNKKNNKLQNLRLIDKVQNHKLGCHIKKIERKMPEETYWYEKNGKEYGIVLNLLLNMKKFVHYVVCEGRLVFDYTTTHRVIYEEAIKVFEQNGAF